MAGMDRYLNLLNRCVSELETCTNYIQQYSANKESDFELIRDLAKQYCEIDGSYKRAKRAQETTDQYFDNLENDCTEDVQAIYQRYLMEQTNVTTFDNHPVWKTIDAAIAGHAVQNIDVQPTDSTENIENLDLDDNQSIDEGILLSQFTPPIDPITKKVITNPCKNHVCGHIYEYSTIKDFLTGVKDRKNKPRCPHIGCSNTNMHPKFLVRDNVLKEQIQNYIIEHTQATGSFSGSFDDYSNVSVD